MGKNILDFIVPILGSVAAVALGQPELLGLTGAEGLLGDTATAALGAGIGGGTAKGVETGNPLAGLLTGATDAAGNFVGSNVGGLIGGGGIGSESADAASGAGYNDI